MTNSVFYVVFALVWRDFILRTSGAVVNIDLVGFEGGILQVPENQNEGEIRAQLSEAVNSVEVTVNCNSLESRPGFTAVQFTPSSASVGTSQVNVTFRIISPGRPVTIQCYAQSQGNNTQFTLSGSKGNTGSLQVVAAPTVLICPDVVLLHKYQLKSSVQVKFSERVQQFLVNVRCSTVEPEAGGPPALQITFTETTVDLGAITAQVPYEVVSLGGPVQVICRAQSFNLTAPIVPPQPSVSTPVESSINSTSFVSVNESATVNMNHTTVSSSAFPAVVDATALSSATPALSVTAVPQSTSPAVTDTTVSSSVSPTISGSSNVKPLVTTEVGGRKRRRRSIPSSDRTVLQYQFNTSAGLPITFALDVSPLRILPQAGFIRAPNGSFSAVLALDQPADDTVDVRCSLDAVLPGDDLRNTSELCFGALTDKVTFANTSVEITLSRKEIQFQKGELFKNINLTLSGSPVWCAVNLVRITCCGQDTGLSLRYANETAVAFAWVDVQKLQPVDWNTVTSGQRKTTLVSDIDLTCPCNLKKNSCDAGCCCDQDCNDFESASSTCIPGFFGGATSEKPFEFSCQASWPDARDWQPFLCVAINNSPLIGFFYNVTTPSLAVDSVSFNTLAENKKRQTFAFLESEERQTTISGGLYTAGTTIKTAARAKDVNYADATVGVLSLPRAVFSGLCSQTASVRFLEDFSSQCVLELEESLCNSQSSWSALNYLMPINLSRPTCSLPAAVLAQGRLSDIVGGIPELASTDVRYYCGDVSTYVSTVTQDSEASVSDNSSSLFESDAVESTTPERCAFDDTETLPPSPVFNKTTRVCSNVVVKAEYEFTWRERRIDAVKARVTLGNVQIPALTPKSRLATSTGAISTISQTFSITFVHSAQLNSSNISRTPFERSGNPGYLRGRPVLSRDLGNSSGQVTAGKIQLWSPGPDSLCSGSTLTPVLYGMNTFSGCLLRLSLDDMRNCTFLREVVLTNQNRLIQATHIGRSGNAGLEVPDDWLPIIREPVSNNSNSSSEEGTCPGIPSGMVIEMLVTDAGKYAGIPQMEVVGTRIRFQFSTWRFKCVSGYGVSCSATNVTDTGGPQVVPSPHDTSMTVSPSVSQNITNSSTTSANVTAGSSVTPTANLSVTPTASASVTPTASSSVMPTASSSISPHSQDNGTRTRQYQPRFEYFMVTSSVVFIKVPAEEPRRVKRTADQSGICYRDVCKEELFFPLTEAYQGEPREKTLALSLFLIFLALVTFAVTKPWG